jgi:hypothetical protein
MRLRSFPIQGEVQEEERGWHETATHSQQQHLHRSLTLFSEVMGKIALTSHKPTYEGSSETVVPKSGAPLIADRCPSPQPAIAAMTGRSVFPSSVRLYSVLGGITGYSRREISPHSSSSRSSLVRIRSLTGGHALRSAENRCGSSRTRAQTILAFHLPPRMREVKATGHGLENFIKRH